MVNIDFLRLVYTFVLPKIRQHLIFIKQYCMYDVNNKIKKYKPFSSDRKTYFHYKFIWNLFFLNQKFLEIAIFSLQRASAIYYIHYNICNVLFTHCININSYWKNYLTSAIIMSTFSIDINVLIKMNGKKVTDQIRNISCLVK